MKAYIDDTVLAESDTVEEVDGFMYFPRESVNTEYLTDSDKEYTCPNKGEAEYYNATIGDSEIRNIAWSYPDPNEGFEEIAGHIAFDKGKVRID